MHPRAITRGLRRLLNPRAADRDLEDEIAQFIAAAADEYARSGISREEAERQARLDFNGIEAAKDAVRDSGWESIPESARRDIAFGVRTLRRNPGFTVVALLTLALGIGASTAMFSVINAVLFEKLPYRDADQLTLIWTDDVRRGLHQEATAFRTIEDWRADTRVFQAIAFYNAGRATITENGERERSRSAFVSGNAFGVLGASAAIGRTITADDEDRRAPVGVISYGLWQRHFHGDSGVIGRQLELEGGPKGGALLTVIGVMPAGFYFPDATTEIWMPATAYWRFAREANDRFSESMRRWVGVGRLKGDATVADARADLQRIGNYLAATYPPTVPDFPGFRTNVMTVRDSITGANLRRALWVLMGGVLLVLLVACANVANLLLARGASRRHELAIRQAVGASRRRLVGQLVVESLILAVIGGAAGVAIAWAAVRGIVTAASTTVPRLAGAGVDWRVLAFALVVAIAAGLIFGVAPALGLTSGLDHAARSTAGVQSRRRRGLLVVTECALTIVLLSGAGLLLRSLDRLHGVDPGFDAANVLAVRIEFPPDAPTPAGESRSDEKARAHRRHAIAADLARRIGGVAGVNGVGFVDDLFIGGAGNESIAIPGRGDLALSTGELAEGAVAGDFFGVLRVPLLRGRYLTNADVGAKIDATWGRMNVTGTLAEKEARADFEPVVVNAEFARRFFPGENPVGRHFCIDPANKTYWYTIVGVVGDMRRQGLARQPIAQYFGPWLPMPNGRVDLLVRGTGDELALAPAIRRTVATAVPGAIVASVSSVDSQLGAFHAERAFQTLLLSVFAGLAIALAAVGIYGVVHFAVNERTRELGVRIALGATPSRIRGQVLREGMRGPLVGIGVGIAIALLASRLLATLLFDVTTMDPAAYAGGAGLLLMVAGVACLVPAIRATKVDPVAALRRE